MSATEIALIKQQMENLAQNIKEMKDENLSAHNDLKAMIEKAMESKADKWVQDAMKWTIGLVMSIVISALIFLVIKQ